MDGSFSNATKGELRHKCLNFDTCHRFEQRLAPPRESKVRSSTIWPPVATGLFEASGSCGRSQHGSVRDFSTEFA
jgi:hypothetical protein